MEQLLAELEQTHSIVIYDRTHIGLGFHCAYTLFGPEGWCSIQWSRSNKVFYVSTTGTVIFDTEKVKAYGEYLLTAAMIVNKLNAAVKIQ